MGGPHSVNDLCECEWASALAGVTVGGPHGGHRAPWPWLGFAGSAVPRACRRRDGARVMTGVEVPLLRGVFDAGRAGRASGSGTWWGAAGVRTLVAHPFGWRCGWLHPFGPTPILFSCCVFVGLAAAYS